MNAGANSTFVVRTYAAAATQRPTITSRRVDGRLIAHVSTTRLSIMSVTDGTSDRISKLVFVNVGLSQTRTVAAAATKGPTRCVPWTNSSPTAATAKKLTQRLSAAKFVPNTARIGASNSGNPGGRSANV